MTFRVGIIFRSWPGQNNKNSCEYPRDDHDEEADEIMRMAMVMVMVMMIMSIMRIMSRMTVRSTICSKLQKWSWLLVSSPSVTMLAPSPKWPWKLFPALPFSAFRHRLLRLWHWLSSFLPATAPLHGLQRWRVDAVQASYVQLCKHMQTFSRGLLTPS